MGKKKRSPSKEKSRKKPKEETEEQLDSTPDKQEIEEPTVKTEMEIITEAFGPELLELEQEASNASIKLEVLITSIKSGRSLSNLERVLLGS